MNQFKYTDSNRVCRTCGKLHCNCSKCNGVMNMEVTDQWSTRTETFRITAKSFIMPIVSNIGSLPIYCAAVPPFGSSQLKLSALAKATDKMYSENPSTDIKDKKYRLFSSTNLNIRQNGNEIIDVTATPLSTDVGMEGPLSPPNLIVRGVSIIKKSPTQFTFSWYATGRPHNAAELTAFQTICPRTSRYIWHNVNGIINLSGGSITISVSITGSKFPSHRVWVNGIIKDFKPQGPFSNLWVASTTDRSRVEEVTGLIKLEIIPDSKEMNFEIDLELDALGKSIEDCLKRSFIPGIKSNTVKMGKDAEISFEVSENVQINRQRGNLYRDRILMAIQNCNKLSGFTFGKEKRIATSKGPRFVDIQAVNRKTGKVFNIEVKRGLSRYHRSQKEKDMQIENKLKKGPTYVIRGKPKYKEITVKYN